MTEDRGTRTPGAPDSTDVEPSVLDRIKRDIEDVKHAIDDLKPFVKLVKEIKDTLEQGIGPIGNLGKEGLHLANQAFDRLPNLLFEPMEHVVGTVRGVGKKGLTFEGKAGAKQKKKFLGFAKDFPESLTRFQTVMAKEIPAFGSKDVKELIGVASAIVSQLEQQAEHVPPAAWAPLAVLDPFFLFYQARDQFDNFVKAVAPLSKKEDVEIAQYVAIVSVSVIVQILGYFESALPMGIGVNVAGGAAAGVFGAAGGSFQPVNVMSFFAGAFRCVFSILLTALQYFPVDVVVN